MPASESARSIISSSNGKFTVNFMFSDTIKSITPRLLISRGFSAGQRLFLKIPQYSMQGAATV